MATVATAVLPLERAKFDLEIEDDGQDQAVLERIGAAVDYTESRIGRPLIRKRERYSLPRPPGGQLLLLAADVVSVDAIGDDDDPDVLTWLVAGGVLIDAPDGGWPEGDTVEVSVTREMDPVPEGIVAACSVILQTLYDGLEIRPTSAFNALVAPYVRTGRTDTPSAHVDAPHAPVAVEIWAWWQDGTEIAAPPVADRSGWPRGARSGTATIPTAEGNLNMVVWRADRAGGDFTEIHWSGGGNSRNIYGAAQALTVDGVAGRAVVTVTKQKAGFLSGESIRVL